MPLIAMTREMGSLGKDVAAAISARLGKPVVHHEIIDQLANKMRLRKSHVIRFLDGKANIWERLTTDKTSLSIYTADETLALAEQRNVGVIRGWGSAHLLRPVQHVICVRICAPMKVRVQRMMERLNTDDEPFVTHEIKLSEEAHAAISRRHFDLFVQNGALCVRAAGQSGLRVGDQGLRQGEVASLSDGERIVVLPKHPQALAIDVRFETHHGVVEQVTLTRQPDVQRATPGTPAAGGKS